MPNKPPSSDPAERATTRATELATNAPPAAGADTGTDTDQQTRVYRPSQADADADTGATNPYDVATRRVGAEGVPPMVEPTAVAGGEEPRTRIYRPGVDVAATAAVTHATDATHASNAMGDAMADPPVGWLVVIDGPGQGHAMTLGMGANTIGREPSERVALPFGDSMISRHSHAIITYDPRGQKFFIQNGSGANLTYLAEDAVLAPQPLANQAEILLGQTKLRFIALCGDDFNWETPT